MILALDTETTGLDLRHKARPFLVTTCDGEGVQRTWEWDVDPRTREVNVPPGDLAEVESLVASADTLALHNAKFDVHALATVGVLGGRWPWGRTVDTVIAGHLLASSRPRDLTSMALRYLDQDIRPWEDALEVAVLAARRLVGSKKFRDTYGEWSLSKPGRADMPSQTKEAWRADYWLPRSVAQFLDYPRPDPGCQHKWSIVGDKVHAKDAVCLRCRGHRWWVVLREYADKDSETTLLLWYEVDNAIGRRGLRGFFRERMKLLPAYYRMESRGVTFHPRVMDSLRKSYVEESARGGRVCVNLARGYGYDLTLPKGASPNRSLRDFCFGPLALKPTVFSDRTGEPSLNKDVLEAFEVSLDPASKAAFFIRTLREKRKYDTAVAYMEAYSRLMVPHPSAPGYCLLHPNQHITGTNTLRTSNNNPNGQQVSKQEAECRRCRGEGEVKGADCPDCHGTGVRRQSLRTTFGPAPGREWYSFDYENVELVIPAYVSGEPSMVELFEKPDDPPYFGSYHLLNASLIYPDLFWPLAGTKGAFKKKYPDTWYAWVKNFGFAKLYGCGAETGDRAARRPGSYAAVKAGLPKLEALNQKCIRDAATRGYVETVPDRTVDPRRGYPVECRKDDWGGVNPTQPLNYMVQSTACWCKGKAVVRVDDYLARVSAREGDDYFIVLDVHDELVVDFPARGHLNRPVVLEVKRLMEQSGDDVGIPLRVSASYHPESWGRAEELPAGPKESPVASGHGAGGRAVVA